MGQYKVGDKVEVIKLVSFDDEYGILVGDVCKVVIANYRAGECYIECHNPKWTHPNVNGRREMLERQIQKVGESWI